MSKSTPSYDELKSRLEAAESALKAIREGRVDTILGERETLVVRLAEAEARQAHLKQVLLAIRNVNQMIVAEDDPLRLIERACVNLTETMGYHNAWIALLGGEAARELGLPEAGSVAATAAAGFDGGFEFLRERLERGQFPQCMSKALASEDVFVVGDPTKDCLDCPLSGEYGGRAGLVRRLEYDGVTWGILTVSVPGAYAREDEEQNLFNEVAGDLAFALHKIAAAQKLEKNQQHLALVMEGSGVGTWEWNVQTNETLFNEQWADMLGYTIEELTPYDYATWERLVHPEDLEQARRALADCVGGRTPDYNCEFRMKHKDSSWVWILDRGCVMTRDDAGKALSMFGTHTDITEIKRTEEALRKEQELTERLIEDGPVGIVRVNRDGEVVFANHHAEQIFGLEKSDIEGRTYNTPDWRITAADGSPFPDEELPFRRVMATGRPVTDVQHAIVKADGGRRILSINGAPLNDKQGQIEGVIFAILDITEHRAADEALKEALLRQQEAVNAGNVGLWDWDLKTDTVRYSAEWKRQIGYKEDEIGDGFDEWQSRVHPDDLPQILGRIKQHIRDRTSAYKVEFRFRHKDGSYLWILAQATVLTDETGEPFRTLGSHVDITERKATEKALRKSEERHRLLFEQSRDAIMTLAAPSWLFTSGNPATIRMFGAKDEADFTSRAPWEYSPETQPDGRPSMDKAKEMIETALQEGTNCFEWQHQRLSGEVFAATVMLSRIRTEDHVLIQATVRDITELKQAEQALRESESRVRMKLNTLLDPEGHIGTLHLADVVDCDEIQSLMNDFHALTDIGIGIIDLDGNILVSTGWQEVCTKFHRAHPETEKLCRESDLELTSGVEPGTFKIYKCKNNMWDMVTPIVIGGKHLANLFLGQFFFEDEAPDIATFREQARRYGFDEEAYLKAYRAIPRWSRENVDRVMTFYCNLINVISRLSYAQIKLARTTETLRRSEGKFRALVDNTIDWVWETDANGKYTFASENIIEILGYTSEEILGRTPFDCMDNEEADRVRSIFQEVVQNRDRIFNLEDTMIHKDGRAVIFETNGTPLFDENGDLMGYFGTCRDITERKGTEYALRKSEALFQTMLAAIPDMISIHDTEMNVVYSNWNGFAAVPPDCRLIGEKCYRIYRGHDKVCPDCLAKQVIETRKPYAKEVELPEGGWYKLNVIPILEPDGNCDLFVEWVSDITERKSGEAERERLGNLLQQAQKLEAVGRLAGGVAHDFNNMLGVILGHADMILNELEPDQPLYTDLMEIKAAGERSAALTRQLLAFARKQTVAPKVIDLDKTVDGMIKMLQRLIGEDIDLIWIPGGKVWPVKIDPGQIDQILANLCVNARDAISDVGKITIETGNTVFDKDCCKVNAGFEPGEYVMITVSDNGCGMDSEMLPHLFEPFFTTKESGKGTGLGLATVYGIVKQNNGFINVFSKPGQGTTFKIYLPRHSTKTAPVTKKVPGKPSQRGHETILLVEDEPAILRVTTKMLEGLGYTVLGTSTPGEAIRLATDHAGDIHLLLTDVVMPEMNGRNLAKNVLSLYPGVKCLFMSGYTANVIAHHGVLDEGVNFIQKPFSIDDLATKTREVLDRD